MKIKKLKTIIIAGGTLLSLLLTGCGNIEIKTYEKDSSEMNTNFENLVEANTNEDSNTNEALIANTGEDSNRDTNTNNTTTQNNTNKKVVSLQFQRGVIDLEEYGILHAYDRDGNEVWKYTTKTYPATELESVEYLEQSQNDDRVYIHEYDTIIALDKQTGNVIWKNSDFVGGHSTYIFDENDTLYIAGYYGPDLCIIDKNGKTLKKYDTISEDYYWPVNMDFDINTETDKNDLIIDFDGGGSEINEFGETAGAKVRVNLNDYTFKIITE